MKKKSLIIGAAVVSLAVCAAILVTSFDFTGKDKKSTTQDKEAEYREKIYAISDSSFETTKSNFRIVMAFKDIESNDVVEYTTYDKKTGELINTDKVNFTISKDLKTFTTRGNSDSDNTTTTFKYIDKDTLKIGEDTFTRSQN